MSLSAYQNGSLPASLMTKREAYAAQILAGLCSNPEVSKSAPFKALATHAVNQADALLAVMAKEEAS